MDKDKWTEILQNKRYQALIKLGLFAIFFVFVGIYYQTYTKPMEEAATTEKTEEKSAMDKYKEMTNYQYNYDYNKDGVVTSIEGKVYHNSILLSLNNIEYFVKDSEHIYQVNNESLINSTLDSMYLINPSQINNYIGTGTIVSKNENYADKIVETKYKITNQIFGASSSEYETYITLSEQDNNITKVEIDISSYLNSIGVTNNKTLIDITYTNVGQVSNFISTLEQKEVEGQA